MSEEGGVSIKLTRMIPRLWYHPSHARGLELDKKRAISNIYKYMFPKPLTALKKENFVVNPVSNSAISLSASSTEFTYPKLFACLPSMVRDLKFSLCCFCLFLKNHGIYSFGCSATSLADFRESSVMFCKSLNIPSQSLSTEVVLVDGI